MLSVHSLTKTPYQCTRPTPPKSPSLLIFLNRPTRSLTAAFSMLLTACGLLFCIHVNAAPIAVHYSLEKEGKFHVLYSRANSNATGAALGGLLGAGIQAGVENGKDERKEAAVLAYIAVTDCAPLLETAFFERLENTGDYSVVDADSEVPEADSDLKVELTIDRCGFKLVNSERMFVAAFAEARYRIFSLDEAKPKSAERLLLLGKSRSTWDGLLNEETEIPLRFERVLKRAGQRLANKVIYRR